MLVQDSRAESEELIYEKAHNDLDDDGDRNAEDVECLRVGE